MSRGLGVLQRGILDGMRNQEFAPPMCWYSFDAFNTPSTPRSKRVSFLRACHGLHRAGLVELSYYHVSARPSRKDFYATTVRLETSVARAPQGPRILLAVRPTPSEQDRLDLADAEQRFVDLAREGSKLVDGYKIWLAQINAIGVFPDNGPRLVELFLKTDRGDWIA